jgi:hypothetical protein
MYNMAKGEIEIKLTTRQPKGSMTLFLVIMGTSTI